MEREQEITATKSDYAVPDASVVIKWFVKEEDTNKAIDLRNDYLNGKLNLACPELLAYEVINALRYKPSIGAKDLEQVATALRKYNFLVYPLLADTLAEQTVELAVKHGITVYDASYLALGTYLECIVYSADQKIIDKIADEKVIKSISNY